MLMTAHTIKSRFEDMLNIMLIIFPKPETGYAYKPLFHYEKQNKNRNYKNVTFLHKNINFFLSFSARSAIELIPSLLLTDTFNQDPLEKHFGKHRSKLGGCDNPTILQYGETERKFQVAKSDSIIVMRGNTSGRASVRRKIDTTKSAPLPKRKKKRTFK